MEEKTKIGNQSSVDSKALNKKLNIEIFGNRLIIHNVKVGSIFDNMFCNLMINGRGRTLLTTDKMCVNTDLKSIDPNVLRDSIEYLDNYDNRGFKSAMRKMNAILGNLI